MIRAAFGLALLATPELVLEELPHPRVDRVARVFARILGARQLLEAAVLERERSPRVRFAGAAVDGVHAATALGIAAWSPPHRRLALANAATAAALSLRAVRRARRARG